MSVNKCHFIGNLTRDPELKYLPSGEAVANCSIACNEKWKAKDGSQQEKVEYVSLTFYRRLAEIAGEYLHKGSLIYVEGKLSTRKWQDKDGNDRYTTEISVNEMQMLGGKPEGGQAAKQPQTGTRRVASDDGLDDDIPF